jgi:hypothetical protein
MSFGSGPNDFWLVKTNASGNMIWNKTYGGASYDVAYSVVQTEDGGYAIAGYTQSFGAGLDDFWLVKTDADGNIMWSKAYGGENTDRAYSIVQASDGGYAIAGYTQSFGAGLDDFWLVKTDADGNAQWNKTYGGTNTDWVMSIVQTNDGGYATAGFTKSFGAGNGDFWLVKLAPEHDVAVIDITPAKIVVDQNCSLNVNVTVENQGVYTETFEVTLYANSTMIHAKAITLTAGNPKTVTFSWNTTGFARGNYTVSAYIEPLLGEIHTANNILVDGQIAIIPEFTSFPTLPLFMMATLLVVIVFRRKYTK